MRTALLIATSLFAQIAFAGICEITIDRKACPGKEAAAYQPYEDKGLGDVPGFCKSKKCNPTVEKKPAKDLADCKKKVEEVSKIQRKGTLTEKSASGKFDGKDAGTFSDKPGC